MSGALPPPLPFAFVTWRGTTLYLHFLGIKVPDKLFLEFEWVFFKHHIVYETVVFLHSLSVYYLVTYCRNIEPVLS